MVEYLRVFDHAGFFLRGPQMIKFTRNEPIDESSSARVQQIAERASAREQLRKSYHFWEV